MVVVPDLMGICLYSPRLDHHANSVRGLQFCSELVRRFNYHNFDRVSRHKPMCYVDGPQPSPSAIQRSNSSRQISEALLAAARGDLETLRR